MPFFEVVYETGASSVAEYDDENEAISAVKAHHERAIKGEAGGPTGHSAERVVKVLMYKTHPNEFNPSGNVTAAEVQKLEIGDTVNVEELAAEIRNLANPFDDEAGPHDSKFKAPSIKELKGWQ